MQALWHYAVGERAHGPVSGENIRELSARGVINSETLVWREGWAEWAPLGSSSLSKLLKQPPPLPSSRARTASQPHPLNTAQTAPEMKNSMATAGLACSIIGLFVVTGILGILGIIFSAIGLSRSNDLPNQHGRGVAISGLVIGIIDIVLMIFAILIKIGNG